MSPSIRKIAIATTAMTAGFFAAAPTMARPMSMRALAAQELRLTTIAYRIATKNVQACPTRAAVSGLVLHDLSRYDQALRPAIARAFSVNGGIGILGVVPGSVADQAGLRVDDEILTVGPYSVQDKQAYSRPKSFAQMENFDRILQSAMAYGATSITIRRQGVQLRVPLRAAYGCGGTLTLTNDANSNAWADGRNVLITTGMTGMSKSEDEIAFVIAHEMAHNILGHVGGTGERRGIFGSRGVKRAEIAADDYAVELMSNGGYSPAAGIAFLENARRRMFWSFSLDHPGFGRRIATVRVAIQRIQARHMEMAGILPANQRSAERRLAHDLMKNEGPAPALLLRSGS